MSPVRGAAQNVGTGCYRRYLVGTLAFLGVLAIVLAGARVVNAETATVKARVEYSASSKKDTPPDASGVVIWLTPRSPSLAGQAAATLDRLPHHFELVQYRKRFDPHLLVVPVGSVVSFPNRDPFFHNVFSLYDGKRFDVGLYEAGSTRSVRFDRAGVSFIFCNIHPQMGAVIITMKTPYYGVSDKSGKVTIPNVPDGEFRVAVWSERALPGTLKNLTRELDVQGGIAKLGMIQIAATGDLLAGHKNLYGHDYDSATPPSFPYEQPE